MDVATIGVMKLKLVAMVLGLVAVVEATIDVKILKPEGTAPVPVAVVTAMVAPESSRGYVFQLDWCNKCLPSIFESRSLVLYNMSDFYVVSTFCFPVEEFV